MSHNVLRDQIHAANVKAGWWTNIQTGESILTTRNRPEMLCLIGSELVEAYLDQYKLDDHLPQFPALHVEIADAVIRILDLAGADQIDLETDIRGAPLTGFITDDLMAVICMVIGDALEGYRKSNTEKYHLAIQSAYATLVKTQELYSFDLFEVVDAKTKYNAQRADHKVENRLKADGKKC